MRHTLSTDIKSRAENLMIVDLMRNDLGRIADLGSVSVTDLFTVETFKTLHQMTSGVRAPLKGWRRHCRYSEGDLPAGIRHRRAQNPGDGIDPRTRDGSRAASIAERSDDFRPMVSALFNVAIRTAVIDRKGAGEMGIGSGIVADSDGAERICRMPAENEVSDRPRTPLRADRDDAVRCLEAAFGSGATISRGWRRRRPISVLPSMRRRCVTPSMRPLRRRPAKRLRVRLLLDEDGGVSVTATAQPAAPADAVMRYVISDTRINSTDLFLYHKTTRRELYDREWKHYSETLGADEVIYLNENGRTRGGQPDDDLSRARRPARDAAALAPVFCRARFSAALIDDGRAVEAPLTIEDVNNAGAIYLGNSVRGLVRAEPLVPRLAVDDRNKN